MELRYFDISFKFHPLSPTPGGSFVTARPLSVPKQSRHAGLLPLCLSDFGVTVTQSSVRNERNRLSASVFPLWTLDSGLFCHTSQSLLQAKHLPGSFQKLSSVGGMGCMLDTDDGPVQDLVEDGLSHRLNPFSVRSGKILHLFHRFFEL